MLRTAGLFLLLGAGALAAAACGDDETTDDDDSIVTSVVVDPVEFLGSLPCADVEGAPRSYTAELIKLEFDDNGEIEPEESLGVSRRVNCATPVAFTEVTAGRRYGAKISVYDVDVEDDADAPAWTTTCGIDDEGEGAAQARLTRQVTVYGCDPITGNGTAETSISIDASSTATELGCTGDEGGLVFTIDVEPIEPADTELPTVTVACGDDPIVFSGDDIVPEERYTFRLTATDFPLEQTWGATCTVVAREGFGVPATCTPLTDRGSLTFPIVDIVDDASLECGEDVKTARVALLAGPATLDASVVDCDADATFEGVPQGSYIGKVELLDGSEVVKTYTCTGAIQPASDTSLTCVEED